MLYLSTSEPSTGNVLLCMGCFPHYQIRLFLRQGEEKHKFVLTLSGLQMAIFLFVTMTNVLNLIVKVLF